MGALEPGGVLAEDGVIVAVGPSVTRAERRLAHRASSPAAAISSPRPHRHARLRRRAGRQPPRDDRHARALRPRPAASPRILPHARTPIRRSTARRRSIICLRRARDTAQVRVLPCAALTKGPARQGDRRDRPAAGSGRGRASPTAPNSVASAQVMRRALTYARDFGALVIHTAEDPDLAARRRDERRRVRELPRAARRARRRPKPSCSSRDMRLVALTWARTHHGARYHRAADASSCRHHPPRQGGGPAGDLRRVDQPRHAERERRRRLPHLPEDLAAAARRGRAARAGRRARRRAPSTSSCRITIRRTWRRSACPSRRRSTARVGLETMLAAGLRLVTAGTLSPASAHRTR